MTLGQYDVIAPKWRGSRSSPWGRRRLLRWQVIQKRSPVPMVVSLHWTRRAAVKRVAYLVIGLNWKRLTS